MREHWLSSNYKADFGTSNLTHMLRLSPPEGPRAGFFLGDGAGVGKGRQIAALLKECWARGLRRAIWVSVSRDLKLDAERDLRDMDACHIEIHPKVGRAAPVNLWSLPASVA